MSRRRSQTLKISLIQYRPDLSRLNAENIPLGVGLELQSSDIALIGLMARTSLPDIERLKLDAVGRHQLQSPSKYLRREFERAMEESPGAVLEYLAKSHQWSLQITEPQERKLPNSLRDFEGLALDRMMQGVGILFEKELEDIRTVISSEVQGQVATSIASSQPAAQPKSAAIEHAVPFWPYTVQLHQLDPSIHDGRWGSH